MLNVDHHDDRQATQSNVLAIMIFSFIFDSKKKKKNQ